MSNLWFSNAVTFAYRYQREARPYKELIGDFSSLFSVRENDRILDIGCGSGRIVELAIEKSRGCFQSMTGIDGSAFALEYAKKNFSKAGNIEFACIDINNGLVFDDSSFDLVTSGLCLQYAEHWDGTQWTDKAYRTVLKDIFRIMSPGGRLVFSVNTPNPDFSVIARDSWREMFFTWKMPLYVVMGAILVAHGRYLTKQANIGRYHYLPPEKVLEILKEAGFVNIRHMLSYSGLALVIACEKE